VFDKKSADGKGLQINDKQSILRAKDPGLFISAWGFFVLDFFYCNK